MNLGDDESFSFPLWRPSLSNQGRQLQSSLIKFMFKFVHIPAIDSESLVELSRPKSGGLENDELQKCAKALFKSDVDGPARLESVKKHMLESGNDPSQLDASMLASINDMGASLEIISLQMPTVTNHYVGVSLYCDGNGTAKHYHVNARATTLARNCGHNNVVVFGDAFIGKCHDDENFEWERMDFEVAEANPQAEWINACAAANSGKNMNSYSTSGNMANILNQSATVPVKDERVKWSQSDDEIEIRIQVDDSLKSKDVRVSMKPSSLSVMFPEAADTLPHSPILAQFQHAISPVALFAKINVGDSTWCIEGKGAKRSLVLSLAKAPAGLRWNTLLATVPTTAAAAAAGSAL